MKSAARPRAIKTIKQSQVDRAWRHVRVGDIVIFDVLGVAPRGWGPTEAAAREDVRLVAEALKAPYDALSGEAFLVVAG
jgi:hypothetical protein